MKKVCTCNRLEKIVPAVRELLALVDTVVYDTTVAPDSKAMAVALQLLDEKRKDVEALLVSL